MKMNNLGVENNFQVYNGTDYKWIQYVPSLCNNNTWTSDCVSTFQNNFDLRVNCSDSIWIQNKNKAISVIKHFLSYFNKTAKTVDLQNDA